MKNSLTTENLDGVPGVSLWGGRRVREPVIAGEVGIEPLTPFMVDFGVVNLGFGFRIFLLKKGSMLEFIIFALGKQSFGFISGFDER